MARPIRALMAFALTSLAAAAAGSPPATIPMAEVDGADAMALAARILPPDIRARVTAGMVRRQFLPGNQFWAGYETKPYPVGRDLCARIRYSVVLRGISGEGEPPAAGTDLAIGPVQPQEQRAIVFPASKADAAGCEATRGFIPMNDDDGSARHEAAYRALVAAVRQARSRKPLPFRLTCEPAGDPACIDARGSLAELPFAALFAIGTSSLAAPEIQDEGAVRLIVHPPVRPNEPYLVTASFGMSGKDGQSWRVRWRATGGPLEALHLSRSLIHYH